MPWLEAAAPVRMERVAVVAPEESLREALARVGQAGVVEFDPLPAAADAATPAAGLISEAGRSAPAPPAAPARGQPDRGELGRAEPGGGEQAGGVPAGGVPGGGEPEREAGRDFIAGEAAIQNRAASALRRVGVAALAGWMPAARVTRLAAELAEVGGAVVPLQRPPLAQPPTLIGGPPSRRALMPLVRTYGVVPYADIDPSWLAWGSYVLMFGMMFGDVGQGLILVAAAFALRAGWPAWARRWRAAWPFAAGAGLASAAFGLLYGECFGPTGLVPALWLHPLAEPIPLLLAAIAAGAVLLAGAYALGTVNRWREGGWPLALYAPSGIAGTALFLGIALAAGDWIAGGGALLIAGAAVASAGLALAFTGFLVEAGGRGTGVAQAAVQLFDLVIRLGSNVVSFARLAAFGLTHAALGLIVWDGARALWHQGGAMVVAAVAVFVAGNVLAFALEALVAAIQALRLEYYELFSRVFQGQGREFQPWRLPAAVGGPERAAPAPERVAAGKGAP